VSSFSKYPDRPEEGFERVPCLTTWTDALEDGLSTAFFCSEMMSRRKKFQSYFRFGHFSAVQGISHDVAQSIRRMEVCRPCMSGGVDCQRPSNTPLEGQANAVPFRDLFPVCIRAII